MYNMDAWMCYLGLFVISLLIIITTLAVYNRAKLTYLRSVVMQSTAFVSRSAILKSYSITVRHGHSTRAACFAFCLLSIVMFAYLRAGLLSKLAVRMANTHLHSLDDLMEHNIKLMLPMGGGIYSSFANAKPDTLRGRLWAENIKPYSERTLNKDMRGNKALDYVLNHGDFGYVTLETSGHQHHAYPCGLAELQERISTIDQSFAYQKDWPLKGLFNYYQSQMRSDGVVQKMFDK